ncbi:MAG TPA: glycosyltransferase family 2 protein [Flexilinea sp.]|jgi:dolichol-phosphate mannosyltransferase|nr:glycosyltransferase family 2 protein [Flexilinea sp.]HOG61248.1 glycosyltransferase family 2 protein [Flexilinea sp.]HOP01077.1 glycosyltransferase family 2 protein [Flexilinea sp.]HOR56135.1 glycosyltransferase family 2 protein [Flexilinea sp.]HOU20235.1 glycosyltransferase family 2 protein [Flexilinea sp.]
MKLISIIIPMFNEEASCGGFYDELVPVINSLPYRFELIFVNDGSVDRTQQILESILEKDRRVQIIQLSRNFGHQAALCAGLENASGDYIITMDGDGQHPPRLIPEMIQLAENGYDIVQTQRLDDEEKSSFKKRTSKWFYQLINQIGDTKTLPGGADFRLITKQVLDNLLAMPEYHRFLRGMVSWLGFRSVVIPFHPEERLAGESKYSLKKMLKLGSDAIFSFSLVPLYVGLSAGGIFFILAVIEVIYVLSFWISGRSAELTPGWSSLMFMMLIIAAVLMILLGFIGIYVGYIFQEVKHRPVFVIKEKKVHPNNQKEQSEEENL